MHERARDAMLGAWGRLVATRPVFVMGICLLLAGASLAITVRDLEFRSNRSELVDPNLSWNRLYTRYKTRFHRWDDVTLCLEGDPDDGRVDALARRISEVLERDPRVIAADAGFSVAETGPRLFAIAPEPVFREVLDDLGRGLAMVAAENANEALGAALADLRSWDGAPDGAPDGLARLERILDPYLATLEGAAPDFAFLRPDPGRWQPLVSSRGSGRLRFIQIQLREREGAIDQLSADLGWLRSAIRAAVEASDVPAVAWGVTGIPAIEADETAQSIHDSTVASIVAFLLITTLMLIVFRGVLVPLLAAASLLIGMSWSFGWLVLSVGHLQLLSVVFSVILLGLGVDFALHLVARLELVQDEHADLPSAVSRVFRGIGPGMLTGAVTTAAAFGATALTHFRGMAEMGVIAGGGILLCLVAMLTSFPAGLALTRRWKRIIRHRPGGETAHFAHGALDVVDFHPAGALAFGLGVAILAALPALAVRYDPNVLNLQPPGIESVRWEQRIVDDDSGSVWSALVETTGENAPSLVDGLRALPTVSAVAGLGVLLPPDREQRATAIAAVRAQPVVKTSAAPGLGPLRQQLAAVRAGLLRRAASLPSSGAEAIDRLAARVGRALAASATLEEPEARARFAALDAAYAADRGTLSGWIEAALEPVPPAPSDLPPMLREQWGQGDTWLLQVLPAIDPEGRSILDPDRLGPFVESLRTVAPEVLGPVVQIHESSELIKREYVKASVFAITAILILLLLDFRSLADALCAMLPVSIGFLDMFGMMGLFGVPLNFANIIVMPLIFGIGVDAGVHIVHRWRAEPYGRPAGLSGGTGRGISLTMLTTMIGFGAMLIAQHRGIRSLGFVMLAGLSLTLLACYTVLPAVLRLRTVHWVRGKGLRD